MLKPLPEPAQIRAYLVTHGWIPEDSPPEEGVVFAFSELSDDGEPVTVLVPGSSTVIFYPLRVNDIVVTVAGIENRPEESVRADLLKTEPSAALFPTRGGQVAQELSFSPERGSLPQETEHHQTSPCVNPERNDADRP